jgi:hypothetical protein
LRISIKNSHDAQRGHCAINSNPKYGIGIVELHKGEQQEDQGEYDVKDFHTGSMFQVGYFNLNLVLLFIE